MTLSELQQALKDLVYNNTSGLTDPAITYFGDHLGSIIDEYLRTNFVSGFTFKGAYNALFNAPNLDILPTIPIENGDAYKVTVAGYFFSTYVNINALLVSTKDNPTVVTDWLITEDATTIVIDNQGANKVITATATNNNLYAQDKLLFDGSQLSILANARVTGTFYTDTIRERSASGVDVEEVFLQNGTINFEIGQTTQIFKDGAGNLSFTDAITGTKTLAELVGGGGVTPVDNILDWDGVNSWYAPYAVGDKAAGRLYSGTTNPSNNTRLNYDGDFYANVVYTVSSFQCGFAPNNYITIGNSNIQGNYGSGSDLRLDFNPAIADGATAIAYLFDTHTNLTTSGAKIVSFKNNGVERLSIDKDGKLIVSGGFIDLGDANFSGLYSTFTAVGSQTNIGINFYAKGTGAIVFSTAGITSFSGTGVVSYGDYAFWYSDRALRGAIGLSPHLDGYNLSIVGGAASVYYTTANGGNVYIYGGAPFSGGVRGEVYFGDGSNLYLTARSFETYMVYVDTATGKLSYGTIDLTAITGIMQVIRAEVLYSDQTEITIITLPAGAVIWDINFEVITLFNDSGTDTLSIGVTGTPAKYYSSVSVATTGWKTGTNLFIFPDTITAPIDIVFTYAGQNDDATTGLAYVYVRYTLH